MSQFDDRQRAEEKKYQLDQELEFKAQARRAKLTGLWAAGHMGLSGEAAANYAKSVVVPTWKRRGRKTFSARSGLTSTCTRSSSRIIKSGPKWRNAWRRRGRR